MNAETEPAEFGICANLLEPDPVFRLGGRVWLCGGVNGDGFEQRIWFGLGRGSGRNFEKWAPTIRFHNYRCRWIPESLRPYILICRGTRADVEVWAAELDALTKERRAKRDERLAKLEGVAHDV